jgi:hypothetical protein
VGKSAGRARRLQNLPFYLLSSPFGPAPDVNVGAMLAKPPEGDFNQIPQHRAQNPAVAVVVDF